MSRRKEAGKLEWFAWEPAAYKADTSHLSREADYAYRRILDEIFIRAQDTGCIPDDDRYLRGVARATAEEWEEIRYELIDGPAALLQKQGGMISSPRLYTEIQRAKAISGVRRDARAQQLRGKCATNAVQEPDNSTAFALQNIEDESIDSSKTEKNPPKPPQGGGARGSRRRDEGPKTHGVDGLRLATVIDSPQERVLALIDAWKIQVGPRPRAPAEQAAWDVAFEARFGFTRDEWNEDLVDCEQWLLEQATDGRLSA
jgi:uncharacterized protein YdaU (DUF1376 family)